MAPRVTDPTPGEPYNPDIIGSYEYIRFFRPTIPASLVGVDLTSAAMVSDEDLLAFLGDQANVPAAGPSVPALSTWGVLALLALIVLVGAKIFADRRDVGPALQSS